MKTIDLKLDRKDDGKPEAYTPPEYPSFTVESSEDHGIPDEGQAVIKFRKRDSSHNEDEDGAHHYRCTLEVREMSKIKGGKGKSKDEEGDEEEAGETEEEELQEETPAPKQGKGKKDRPAAVAAVLGRGEY